MVSTAIKRDNPELVAARTRRLPVVRRAEVLGPVPDRDARALFAQALHVGGVGGIRALHRVAEVDQHLGDAAHADAADADKVDRSDIGGQFHS